MIYDTLLRKGIHIDSRIRLINVVKEDVFMNPGTWDRLLKYRDRATKLEFSKASKFRARVKLTRGLRSISIPSLSTASAESYFVLTKLAFSYSAIEAVEFLSGRNTVKVSYQSARKALESGQFTQLVNQMVEIAGSLSRDTSSELKEYQSPKIPENLRPLVKHARHVMFHASATPNSLGLQNSTHRRELLLGLANATLAASERVFIRWLDSLENRPRTR